MATIMPEGEALRKAVKWISARREEAPHIPVGQLVHEAALHFDLSPKDEDFLLAFLRGDLGKSHTPPL